MPGGGTAGVMCCRTVEPRSAGQLTGNTVRVEQTLEQCLGPTGWEVVLPTRRGDRYREDLSIKEKPKSRVRDQLMYLLPHPFS